MAKTVAKPKSAMASLLTGDLDQHLQVENNQNELNIINARPILNNNLIISDNNKRLVSVHWNQCQPWNLANRPKEEFGNIDDLANSMKMHGQQEPILIRLSKNDDALYEIIFGRRRWEAAKKHNLELDAIITSLSDKAAFLCQAEENSHRKDISNYARALSFELSLKQGIYKTQQELCEELGISKQALSDILSYLRVPIELRSVIFNYRDLSINMVKKLASLTQNKEDLAILKLLADKISAKKVTTNNIESMLQKLRKGERKDKNSQQSNIIIKTSPDGMEIYRIEKKSSGKINILIKNNIASRIDVNKLHHEISKIIFKCIDKNGA